MFFTPEFREDFNWPPRYELRVGSVLPKNKKQISEGLREMSPETIRNRFLGSKRDFSDKELQYLTELDGWNHYAIGIEEREKLKRGVGVIRLVRSSHDESEAEVAILLIDDYQRKGLGPFMMNLIVLAALERNITTLSFTYLPQNDVILKLIKRVGTPEKGNKHQDYDQVFLDLKKLDLVKIRSQLATILPGIGTFPIET